MLSYITGDRLGLPVHAHISPDALPIIANHVRSILSDDIKGIDLFLYSRGGQSDTPSSIVTFLREVLRGKEFSVLIPYIAHSAATVIAIGADKIVMTPLAELGPIDATIQHGPHNPRDPVDSSIALPISVEDVRGYLELLEVFGVRGEDERIQAFSDLTSQVSALGLGAVNRLLTQTKRVAEQLLNLRKTPLSSEINKNIVGALSSEIASHSHSIRRSEAKNIGIDFISNAEEINIQDDMVELFDEYKKLLSLDQPFDFQSDMDRKGAESYECEADLAVIESGFGTSIFRSNVQVTRMRRVPPDVTLNVNPIINLPSIEVKDEAGKVEGSLEDYVHGIVREILHGAAEIAAQELVKASPSEGFRTMVSAGQWIRE